MDNTTPASTVSTIQAEGASRATAEAAEEKAITQSMAALNYCARARRGEVEADDGAITQLLKLKTALLGDPMAPGQEKPAHHETIGRVHSALGFLTFFTRDMGSQHIPFAMRMQRLTEISGGLRALLDDPALMAELRADPKKAAALTQYEHVLPKVEKLFEDARLYLVNFPPEQSSFMGA